MSPYNETLCNDATKLLIQLPVKNLTPYKESPCSETTCANSNRNINQVSAGIFGARSFVPKSFVARSNSLLNEVFSLARAKNKIFAQSFLGRSFVARSLVARIFVLIRGFVPRNFVARSSLHGELRFTDFHSKDFLCTEKQPIRAILFSIKKINAFYGVSLQGVSLYGFCFTGDLLF